MLNTTTHPQAATALLCRYGGGLAMGLLLVLLLFLAIFAAPAWRYSAGWGYYPSGGALLLLVILAIVFFSRPRRTV